MCVHVSVRLDSRLSRFLSLSHTHTLTHVACRPLSRRPVNLNCAVGCRVCVCVCVSGCFSNILHFFPLVLVGRAPFFPRQCTKPTKLFSQLFVPPGALAGWLNRPLFGVVPENSDTLWLSPTSRLVVIVCVLSCTLATTTPHLPLPRALGKISPKQFRGSQQQ